MIAAMARVQFHEARGHRWELELCRQVEAALGRGERIYVWADSEAAARSLDELLWTFRDDAFVPHALWQGEASFPDPVAVGWRAGNPNGATLLVLARDAEPRDLRGFARVLDFAPVDVAPLADAARRRYRAFRAGGHAVEFVGPAP